MSSSSSRCPWYHHSIRSNHWPLRHLSVPQFGLSLHHFYVQYFEAHWWYFAIFSSSLVFVFCGSFENKLKFLGWESLMAASVKHTTCQGTIADGGRKQYMLYIPYKASLVILHVRGCINKATLSWQLHGNDPLHYWYPIHLCSLYIPLKLQIFERHRKSSLLPKHLTSLHTWLQ